MTGRLWLPTATRRTPHARGGSMAGGPPRMVHHITWDQLGPHGERPSFDAIAAYLTREHYEPHVMGDPFTGRLDQWLPADRSAYALRNASGGVETNRMGSVCLQVEWLFSPGTVYKGRRYDTLADTPMRGLDELLEWADGWGIPRAWPMGSPSWRSNRSPATWKTKAGHYGHSQVPENTHTDPGPMPPISRPAPAKPPVTPPPAVKPAPHPPEPPAPPVQEDDMAARIKKAGDDRQYLVTPQTGAVPIEDPTELGAWSAVHQLPELQVLPDAQVDALVRAAAARR